MTGRQRCRAERRASTGGITGGKDLVRIRAFVLYCIGHLHGIMVLPVGVCVFQHVPACQHADDGAYDEEIIGGRGKKEIKWCMRRS